MKELASFVNTPLQSATKAPVEVQPLFTRLLVPTDFSHRSEAAVKFAVEIARRMHAKLTLLHIVPEPSAFDYSLGGFPPGDWEQTKVEAEHKLAEETMRTKLTYGEVDSSLRTGLDLHQEILRAAKEIAADLLVLSTHGYTGWKHLFFGSDAEKILNLAHCPILVVRPKCS